jgi:hypothetical protein
VDEGCPGVDPDASSSMWRLRCFTLRLRSPSTYGATLNDSYQSSLYSHLCLKPPSILYFVPQFSIDAHRAKDKTAATEVCRLAGTEVRHYSQTRRQQARGPTPWQRNAAAHESPFRRLPGGWGIPVTARRTTSAEAPGWHQAGSPSRSVHLPSI